LATARHLLHCLTAKGAKKREKKTGLALSITALAAAGCVLGILVRVLNGVFLAMPF
jgi:hypothetical protein